MNGPRSTLEPLRTFNDRDIWSSNPTPTEAGPDADAQELREAARRLQQTLIRCGCLESVGKPGWTRRPLRPDQR